MQLNNEVNEVVLSNSSSTVVLEESSKEYFINNENFELLKKYQQLIFKTTEVSPAIRKLVNELINVENLEKIKERYFGILKK